MNAIAAATTSSAPPKVSARRTSPIRLTSGQDPRSNSGFVLGVGTGLLHRGSAEGPPTRLPGTPSWTLREAACSFDQLEAGYGASGRVHTMTVIRLPASARRWSG